MQRAGEGRRAAEGEPAGCRSPLVSSTRLPPAAYRLRLAGFLGDRGRGGQALAVLRAVEGAVRGVLFLDRPPPLLVAAIPGDRLRQALFERRRGTESQSGELAGVERVTPVVPGTVVDEADQALGLFQLVKHATSYFDVF